jgi:uncharacterized protein YbjT (DUF2867 family)
MTILLFGATGMIGHGALSAALADPRVSRVLTVGRRPTGRAHPKLDELVLDDFFDYTAVEERLTGFDACLFCLGVSAAGKSEAAYRRLTYDLTLAAAETLVRLNPGMTFVYVSGEGTDADGRAMWARVKGETERALSALPFAAVYHFRPAYIQPQGDARSRITLYRVLYAAFAPLYPALRRVFPGYVTTTDEVGRALVEAGLAGAPSRVLDSRAIRALGQG